MRKLFIEPLIPSWLGDWADRRRHSNRIAAWHDHSPIHPEFAAAMAVETRAPGKTDTIFFTACGAMNAIRGLSQVDYVGDWHAAEKAVTGVEVRDPTADIDVISYCFGVPPEQYLAEGTDRSLIRRAMWGLLPEAVLTNRLSGLQAADWHEKLEKSSRANLRARSRRFPNLHWRGGSSTWPGSKAHQELAERRLAQGRNIQRIQSRPDARAGRRPFSSLDRIGKLTALRDRGPG